MLRVFERSTWAAAALSLLFPSLGWAQGVMAPARIKMAAPTPGTARPIAIPARISVQIVPPQKTVIIGEPAVLTVQVSSVGLSAPIVLTAQTSSKRTVTLVPPQVQPGGNVTATLTLNPAADEQPGTHTVTVQATAGGVTAQSPPATLNFADPECGSGPPSLSFSLPGAMWRFQVAKDPAPASVKLRLVNSGGRLPTPVTLRIHNIGSDCRNGNCIRGPLLPSGSVGMMDIPLRGGCARTLFDGEIPATSSVLPINCRPGSKWVMGVNAMLQVVVGPEAKGPANLVLDCSTVTR